MRKLLNLTLAALAALTVPAFAAPYGGCPVFNQGAQYYRSALSPQEVKDLLHMREEEKLARDVYLTLSSVYPIPVFRNIARAEQRHMDAVGTLLKRYGIKDPVAETGDRVGVFKDLELQKLYTELVNRGKRSLIDALKVGATVEDLDIKDLEEALSRTNRPDIKFVYSNLMKGSRNHMRAFVRTLRRFGSDYSPHYISRAEFNRILSTPHEVGPARTGLRRVELRGEVLAVYKRSGLGRTSVKWWVVELQTPQGRFSVFVSPSWLHPRLSLSPGDTVELEAFSPPYFGSSRFVACKLKNLTSGAVYDFSSWRKVCGRL
ncbi:Protein of unknown function DUF2202 [Thermovibrio ammonificans HB-1]|uniref:DUF2202 domain-containing protein n=1 Tax=Thermovibrio ammonificans (strain DSM 15698 / JCM 12110 / HB-1) TaxID=648996 RepID=E8T203_THEA1|nr:DUF2202 domain-containing protein [Thermovibrio ammonificans]ADU96898.1 Protein of unknown function DUF2202 [Thermovibrio ammonificans HB-1]